MNLTWHALGIWINPSTGSHRRRNKQNHTIAAEINILESRALLASDISGTWFNVNQATNIQQSGNELVLTNEFGQSTTGRFINGTQIVADQWNGITGTISGDRINWSNNTIWTRNQETFPNISGTWYFGNQATSIAQNGQSLTLTNEQGVSSQGRFLSSSEIIADDWGGLRGTLVNSATISWTNGDRWTRTQGTPNPGNPTLAQNWIVAANGGTAHVSNDGNGGLTFTNVAGGMSAGYFTSSTQVYASTWGITGTLNSSTNPTRITWSNGSVWNTSSTSPPPSSNPPLASDWIAAASGGSAHITDDGNGGLIFTNVAGRRSAGLYSSSNQVYANDWGITGTLNSISNPTRITWSNGSVWNRATA